MNSRIDDLILRHTGATRIIGSSLIQTLWSGYGEIRRLELDGGELASVVVKHVRPPQQISQPRGWNTEQSHQRKLRSYVVESEWYRNWAYQLSSRCRVPKCHLVRSDQNEHLFVLEDLDASGFDKRFTSFDIQQIRSGLNWLAYFHASFLPDTLSQPRSEGALWPTGTYWHLETRPDELAEMRDDEPLKVHAEAIDQRLSRCQYPTVVHGDAKVANFCFSSTDASVAAVDFQYVGGGCGMKDVAYFLGSCLTEEECESLAEDLLSMYFATLSAALKETQKRIDAAQVESEWRSLYPLAWADFNRFLLGWYPQHHKLHGYSRRMTDEALAMVRSSSADTD